ncbi:helix-turn-helix transcriptional regulator [Lactiplantibacillus pentosus]|uniref:helix-turn-helix transcriptional regulator n=1 Tax=Lactiplantibacillus pentosus TaxID=1589 RepID=UPI003C19DE84
MTFAESLKRLRHDNSLTQNELAEKLYISRQSISKWELRTCLISKKSDIVLLKSEF